MNCFLSGTALLWGQIAVDLYISRLLHILPALILGGGVFYLRFVWLPATRQLAGQQAETTLAAMRRPWSILVAASALLLLASGFYNFFSNVRSYDLPPLYHMLFGMKFLLALAVFFISSALAGKTSLAEKMREKMPLWLNLNTAAVLILVVLASLMRMIDHVPKAQ